MMLFLVLGILMIVAASFALLIRNAHASAFTPGNLVIYRVGDGSAALASSATAVFLDEYTTSGGSPVQSIAMPTVVNASNKRLTASGTATSEGLMTRSVDGKYLTAAGYDAALATATPASSTSSSINRVIARVDSSGAIDTTTALSDAASSSNPRSAFRVLPTALLCQAFVANGIVDFVGYGPTAWIVALDANPSDSRRMVEGFVDAAEYRNRFGR